MPTPVLGDTRPPLSLWRFWALFSVVLVAGFSTIASASLELRFLDPEDSASLLVIIGLLALLEMGPLLRGRSARWQAASSSLMFIFALLLHWGLAAAIIGQAITLLLAGIINRRAPWRILFNVSQFATCLAAAQLVFASFGQEASLATTSHIDVWTLPALLVAGVVWFAVNSLLVGTLISLEFNTSWWHEVSDDFTTPVALNDGAAIALAPLVVLAAERSAWLVPLLLVPLLAVYKGNVVSIALKHQAGHDALTGLPNRSQLLDRALKAFAAVSGGRAIVGLFVLDLDRFKEINDTLGHQAGDELLKVIAERLIGAVRPGDLVARLGGDEFAVLLPDLDGADAARLVAARIAAAVRAPLHLYGVMLNVDSSLGIALAPEHGKDFETLLQRADLAMYSAKQRGTSYETYTPELASGSASRLNLLGDLRRALESGTSGELALHYQPQVNLHSGEVVGVEALLRWTHPQRGAVGPAEYISKVEHTALMRSLTHRVVDEALAQSARWEAAGLGVRVAVNVSVSDLHREEFAGFVTARLQHWGVVPGRLQLEITEGALMLDPARVLSTLHALKRLGVPLSLDDFGTGYSSMSQLHRLPVEEIKIDRSFIARMGTDEDDRTIVRSMIELGRALGLRVVAEGVEDEATWRQLGEMGCDDGQGWHIARALPAAQMTNWLVDHARQLPPLSAAAADIA